MALCMAAMLEMCLLVTYSQTDREASKIRLRFGSTFYQDCDNCCSMYYHPQRRPFSTFRSILHRGEFYSWAVKIPCKYILKSPLFTIVNFGTH